MRGAQRPRVELIPTAAYADLGDDAVALCEAVGLVLDPWQEHVVRGMLGERLDGKFSASQVGVVVPRQQGKGVILEARALAGMFLLEEPYIIWTAHELKTAQAAFLRLRGWIDGSPDLSKRVRTMYTGNTENSIILNDGRALRFLARTQGSGRGLTASTLILDEAYALKQAELAALMPTLATAENPQTIYTSSAGMPNSEVLADLRERGMDKKSRGLAYFEWSAEDDADPDDLDALATANPGLGTRLSLDHVGTERAAMDEETFKRERLGIWARIGGDSVIPARAWADGLDAGSPGGERIAFAVDVTPARDMATIAAVSELGDGRWHVQVVDRRVGTSWVPSAVRTLAEKWRPVAVVVDEGSGAGALVPELRREGVRTTALNMRQYGLACAALFDAICQGRVVHPGQADLNAAVDAAQKKDMGDSLWKWNRKTVVEDISPLVAVTHAWHGLALKSRRVSDGAVSGRAAGRRVAGRRVASRGGGAVASGNGGRG